MGIHRYISRTLATALIAVIPFIGTGHADAAGNKSLLTQDAEAALESLYKNEPAAKVLGTQASGILVFPKIVRAGFIVGGSGGEGVLFKNGKPSAHYSSGSASVGLQAGVQSFGYAVFFLTNKDLQDFQKSSGWDIGASPTVVVVDAGAAKEINTTTAKKGVYAFTFNQEGLMAGVALQGQKITKIK